MKNTELRIGNYITGIYYDSEVVEQETLCEVLGVDSVDMCEYSIWVDSEANEEYYEFKPILLTEEWLLKFGFVKIKGAMVLHFLKSHISIRGILDDRGFGMALDEDDLIDDRSSVSLWTKKYVHQLQNLCFALAGEELEILSQFDQNLLKSLKPPPK